MHKTTINFFNVLLLVLAATPFAVYADDSPLLGGTPYDCDVNALKSDSSATFMANWEPLVLKITLDSKYYASASATGQNVSASATPNPIYIKYDTGVYSDSEATKSIANLTAIPKHDRYLFNGFYTGKASTGDKVVNSAGEISVDDVKTMYVENGNWYASYTQCTCTKGTNVKTCTVTGTTNDNKCQYSFTCLTGYKKAGETSGTFTGGANQAVNTSPNCADANTVELTYVDEDAVTPVEPESGTCTYGETFNLPVAPTKRGYEFKGWSLLEAD